MARKYGVDYQKYLNNEKEIFEEIGLNHPNIVKYIKGFAETDENSPFYWYFAYEFVEGGELTIKERIPEKKA